jgi:hypothetical protein
MGLALLGGRKMTAVNVAWKITPVAGRYDVIRQGNRMGFIRYDTDGWRCSRFVAENEIWTSRRAYPTRWEAVLHTWGTLATRVVKEEEIR